MIVANDDDNTLVGNGKSFSFLLYYPTQKKRNDNIMREGTNESLFIELMKNE